MYTLQELNDMTEHDFTNSLKDIYEHSPWVAERAAIHRPFFSRNDLHSAMVQQVRKASLEEQTDLICAHPVLGTSKPMSRSSVSEQEGAGLQHLTDEEQQRFNELNTLYMERFEFPFIYAVKNKTKRDIYESLEARVELTKEQEREQALEEIFKIANFRLDALLTEEKERRLSN